MLADPVKLGLRFGNADWRADPAGAVEFARAAEACGFESVWAVDRPSVPWQPSAPYPYAADGRLPAFFHEIDLPDPLLWLTWVAAHTSTLGLATGVLVLPLRPAVLLAKQAASLDALSGGRLHLGVGAGWSRDEFAATGADFDRRRPALEESIAALRVLWRDPHASFAGDTVAFTDLDVRPRPAPGRRIPIVIGGAGRYAAACAGRLGDGFCPARGGPDEIAGLVGHMRRVAVAAGRDPDGIEVTVGVPDPASVPAYRRAGAHRVLFAPPGRDPGTCRDALAGLAASARAGAGRTGR